MEKKIAPRTKKAQQNPSPPRRRTADRQPEEQVRAAALAPRRQVRHAARARQRLRDLLRGVDASDFNQTRAALLEGPRNDLGGGGLALGANHRSLFFLFRFRDDVRLALGLLLGDLLLLDGAAELLAEDEVRDRHVVQNNVEVVGALRERTADLGPVRALLLNGGDGALLCVRESRSVERW